MSAWIGYSHFRCITVQGFVLGLCLLQVYWGVILVAICDFDRCDL
jgi:hypothetical protein